LTPTKKEIKLSNAGRGPRGLYLLDVFPAKPRKDRNGDAGITQVAPNFKIQQPQTHPDLPDAGRGQPPENLPYPS
jgi:hypothetical protein